MAYLPTITTPYLKTYLPNQHVDDKLDELDKKVNKLSQDVTKNTNDITSLNNEVNKVDENVNKKINELSTKVDKQNENLSTRITKNTNDISSLNTTLNNVENNTNKKINELNTKITINSNDISIINIYTNNKTLTDKVNEHENRIRTLESHANSGSIFYDGNIFKKVVEEGDVNQIQQDGTIEQIHYDYYLYNECYDYKVYHGKTTGSRFHIIITHTTYCIVIPHIALGEFYVGPKDATRYTVFSFQLPSFISILRINYLEVYQLNALATVWNFCKLGNNTKIDRLWHTGGSKFDSSDADKVENDYYILP